MSTTSLLSDNDEYYYCIRLTIGLMGLDDLHLRVLAMSSDDELERKNSTKGQGKDYNVTVAKNTETFQVLKLLRKGRHWVLVVSYTLVFLVIIYL